MTATAESSVTLPSGEVISALARAPGISPNGPRRAAESLAPCDRRVGRAADVKVRRSRGSRGLGWSRLFVVGTSPQHSGNKHRRQQETELRNGP
jgi:hypothetical protein